MTNCPNCGRAHTAHADVIESDAYCELCGVDDKLGSLPNPSYMGSPDTRAIKALLRKDLEHLAKWSNEGAYAVKNVLERIESAERVAYADQSATASHLRV